ncbi:MAG: hypothetical protein ACR2PJ_04215 [Pseudomonadales bacterium]
MFQSIKAMGALRNLLHATALVFAALMPLALSPAYTDRWNLFFSGILPATAPIIVIVICLDIMMSQIWKSDAPAQRVALLNRIIWAHLIVGGLLLGSWLAVFLPAIL